MLPYNKSLKGNARALRKNMTNAEIKIPITKTTRTNPPTPFFKGGDTGITKGGEYCASNDSVSVNLIGQNPAQADALSVLCKDGSPFASAGLGFTANFLAATAYQESGYKDNSGNISFRQFIDSISCNSRTSTCPPAAGVPMQSFDNGYGIMQLTNGIPGGLNSSSCVSSSGSPLVQIPTVGTPTQDMVWSWVSNLNAGTWVMLKKLNYAATYQNRMMNIQVNTPPADALQMNTWQAYNGNYYYICSCINSDPITQKCTACKWIPNTAALLYNYGPKCKSVNPSYVYADCAKYWSNQNLQWCK